MNFIKKASQTISKGCELENLKCRRSSLNTSIEEVRKQHAKYFKLKPEIVLLQEHIALLQKVTLEYKMKLLKTGGASAATSASATATDSDGEGGENDTLTVYLTAFVREHEALIETLSTSLKDLEVAAGDVDETKLASAVAEKEAAIAKINERLAVLRNKK